MSRLLISIAALGLIGAASLPLSANAAERHEGAANAQANTQLTDVSSQYRWRRHYGYRHHYWGPRYGYYRPYRYGYYRPYRYGYYGHPYGYYRPGPVVSFGFGPFGFRAF